MFTKYFVIILLTAIFFNCNENFSEVKKTLKFEKTNLKAKYIERIKKICIHELGHNLGLKHCEFHEKCVMRDAAETIKTIDYVFFIFVQIF